MERRFHFLRESIKNIRATGSVAPSSKYLCRGIIDQIDFALATVVVELGPGDGVITRYLLESLRPSARLLVFEVNDVFVHKLRKEFSDPRVTVIHDSAENMSRHFNIMGIEQVDYFISGIPFVMLPETLAERVIGECRAWLRQGGRFLQFHYSPLKVRFYRKMFGNAQLDFVPFNIPPALIITCTRE